VHLDSGAVNEGTTPLRQAVRGGARRLGVEDRLTRLYDRIAWLRAGRAARRNLLDNDRARLVAASVLTESSNCIDVGANEGLFLELFTRVAPLGSHIAYEPVPALAEELARRFPSVDVRRTAVADRRGTTTFQVHRSLASRSSLRPVGYGHDETETTAVQIEDLDSALPDGYEPHLIKVDVEGAEQLVIEGARQTLDRHGPVLLFEHQRETASHYGSGPEQLWEVLAGELAYRIFDLDGRGPLSRADLVSAFTTGSRLNFMARR